MRQLTLNTLALCLIAFALAGCIKKTEEQRLAEFRDTFKYKAYHLASDKSVSLAVRGYNLQASEPAEEQLVHSTLGILWLISNNSNCAMIEADMLAASVDTSYRNTGLGLQSVSLAKMEYPRLAQQHYTQLKEALAAERGVGTDTIEMKHRLFLLSLITVSFYQGDAELAHFAAEALGANGQLDYLPPLIRACVAAKEGHSLEAVAQLSKLAISNDFAEKKKVLFSEVGAMIANNPDSGTLGEALTQRLLATIVPRVLDDIFTAEDQRGLLRVTRELPAKLPGKS